MAIGWGRLAAHMESPLYVLILAGGSGERFWPLSRRSCPKQLLPLVSQETLLESTLSRLEGLVPKEQILILTNTEQVSAVRQLVGHQLPGANIVAEPAKRDTAAAIALGVGWIKSRAPQATMIVLSADHVIENVKGFQSTLRAAAQAALQSGDLVTIGIRPTWACPGFGYIEQGLPYPLLETPDTVRVSEVVRFREKPDAATAQNYLQQGNFWWNAGIFVWSIASIVQAFERDAPALGHFVAAIAGAGDFEALLGEAFPQLPKISIDYAILEKAPRVLMVEAGFDWDDVGSWPAIAKYFEADEMGNQSRAPLKALDSRDNIVFSNQKSVVALVGVSDLIVVQTADALLICHRNDAEKIKHLVADLPPELQ